MQDKRETSDSMNPTAYELGKMFYRAGRRYIPYQDRTNAQAEFLRGKRDAAEEEIKFLLDNPSL